MSRSTYAQLALRTGVVTPEALRRALARQDGRDGSLEADLLRSGALDPALAPVLRAALVRAQVTCERCGGWSDGPLRGEAPCRCPGARLSA